MNKNKILKMNRKKIKILKMKTKKTMKINNLNSNPHKIKLKKNQNLK